MTDEETPPLRDRNRFFNWLLHGDLTTYARVAPAWRERRRTDRRTRKVETRSGDGTDTVRPKHDVGEAKARALRTQLERDKQARRSCRRMLRSIRVARRRIRAASRLGAGDEAVNHHKVIAKRIRTVRKYAVRLNGQMSPDSAFDQGEISKLDIELPGGDAGVKVRSRKYKDVTVMLDTFARRTTSIRRDIAARRRAVKREERAWRERI